MNNIFFAFVLVFAVNWIVVFALGYLVILYMMERQLYFSGLPEMYLTLVLLYFISYKFTEYLNGKYFGIRKSGFIITEIIALLSISYALFRIFLYALSRSSWGF